MNEKRIRRHFRDKTWAVVVEMSDRAAFVSANGFVLFRFPTNHPILRDERALSRRVVDELRAGERLVVKPPRTEPIPDGASLTLCSELWATVTTNATTVLQETAFAFAPQSPTWDPRARNLFAFRLFRIGDALTMLDMKFLRLFDHDAELRGSGAEEPVLVVERGVPVGIVMPGTAKGEGDPRIALTLAAIAGVYEREPEPSREDDLERMLTGALIGGGE